MTTIVYDHLNKQIALDSRTCAVGDIINDKSNKFLKKDGDLWVYTGLACEIDRLTKLKHGDKFEGKLDLSAFVVKDGRVYYAGVHDGQMCFDERDFNDHLGSGGYFAYCALDFGKTAKEAVKYAITKDCYSGGKVWVFNLDGKEVEE